MSWSNAIKERIRDSKLFVVGRNEHGQLGLGCRAWTVDMEQEITKWHTDIDTIPTPTNVHNADDFAMLTAVVPLVSLTYGFIREICDRVPDPIMRVCVAYGSDCRSFVVGNDKNGVGNDAEETAGVRAFTHFTDRAIHAPATFTHPVSGAIYWIAAGQVYEVDHQRPSRIPALDDKQIVDIQPSIAHSIALSASGHVYASGIGESGECGRVAPYMPGWHLISALQHTTIRQIAVGATHSVFLDFAGVVYVCGYNRRGQLGLGHKHNCMLPTAVPFRDSVDNVRHDVRVTRIAAGGGQILAVDTEHRAHAWGFNINRECGIDQGGTITSPKMISIRSRSSYRAVDVKCGLSHSLLVTADGEHCLFGRNQHNQVTLVQSRKTIICKPTAIDSLFSQRGLEVVKVCLGNDNTWIWTAQIESKGQGGTGSVEMWLQDKEEKM